MDLPRVRRGPRKAAEMAKRLLQALALIAWWFTVTWLPRRPPDLKQLVRRAEFRQPQAAVAAWIDEHFSRIEGGAPWLDRSGYWVHDWCGSSLRSRAFSFPRDQPAVACAREVTAAYGADGDLGERVRALKAALASAGWTIDEDHVKFLASLATDYKATQWPFSWSAAPGFDLPDAIATVRPTGAVPLPASMTLGIGWASRGGPVKVLAHTLSPWSGGDRRAATPVYRPVQVTSYEVDDLVAATLSQHAHAFAIRINVGYYHLQNVTAKPWRLRKRLVPTWRPGSWR